MSSPRPALSAYELRREGWIALTERLGVSGAMRFLMQYGCAEAPHRKQG